MNIAHPLSDETFLLVVEDAMSLYKREYEEILVSIRQYNLTELREPFEYGELSKRELIMVSFEEGDTWTLLSELHKREVLQDDTLLAMAQDGVTFNNIDENNQSHLNDADDEDIDPPEVATPAVTASIRRFALINWVVSLPTREKVALIVAVIGATALILAAILGGFAQAFFANIFGGVDLGSTPVVAIAPGQVTGTSPPPTETPTLPEAPTETSSPTSQPSLTPTPPPTFTATTVAEDLCLQQGDIVFEDDFSSNSQSWQLGDVIDYPYTDEERSIISGAYRVSAFFKEDALSTNTVPFVNSKDFWVAFEAGISNKSGTGHARIAISFRINPEGDYYSARFGDDGLFSLYLRQGEFFTPVIAWTETEAFDLAVGNTNSFQVTADGWEYTLCANGKMLAQVIDPSLNQPGRIGIGLSGEQGVSAVGHFDDVRVLEIHGSPAESP